MSQPENAPRSTTGTGTSNRAAGHSDEAGNLTDVGAGADESLDHSGGVGIALLNRVAWRS